MADDTPLLPPDLEAALRAPVGLASAERARRTDSIMAAVAVAPAPRRWSLPLSLPPSLTRWRRRGVLAPAGALATTLLVTAWLGVTSFTNVFERSGTVLARAEVLGDTVIPRTVARAVAGDTVYDTIDDTMRIVRFALHAPSATRVALVQSVAGSVVGSVAESLAGTLAGTIAGGVPHTVRDSAARSLQVARNVASGLWELRTVVPRGAVPRSFEFVVNGTDRVPVRATSFSAAPTGARPASRTQPSSDTAL